MSMLVILQHRYAGSIFDWNDDYDLTKFPFSNNTKTTAQSSVKGQESPRRFSIKGFEPTKASIDYDKSSLGNGDLINVTVNLGEDNIFLDDDDELEDLKSVSLDEQVADNDEEFVQVDLQVDVQSSPDGTGGHNEEDKKGHKDVTGGIKLDRKMEDVTAEAVFADSMKVECQVGKDSILEDDKPSCDLLQLKCEMEKDPTPDEDELSKEHSKLQCEVNEQSIDEGRISTESANLESDARLDSIIDSKLPMAPLHVEVETVADDEDDVGRDNNLATEASPDPDDDEYTVQNYIQIFRCAEQPPHPQLQREVSREFCYRLFMKIGIHDSNEQTQEPVEENAIEIDSIEVSTTLFCRARFTIKVEQEKSIITSRITGGIECERCQVKRLKDKSVPVVSTSSTKPVFEKWLVNVKSTRTNDTPKVARNEIKRVSLLELWCSPVAVEPLNDSNKMMATQAFDPKTAFLPDVDFEQFYDAHFPDSPVAWV